MDGILIINKHKGCTSHDIVHKIKKITKFLLGQEKCDEDHIFKTRADLLLHTNNQTYECFYKRQ